MKHTHKREFASALSLLLVAAAMGSGACTKKETTSNSPSSNSAQQIGDVMASIDEMGGSSGTYAVRETEMIGAEKMWARMIPNTPLRGPLTRASTQTFSRAVLPTASAATCAVASTWGTCTNNVVVRDFGGCTIGAASLTGTITLDFNDGVTNNICTVDSDGDTISRSPAFTIAGGSGGTFTVSKTGAIGQRVTRTSSGVFSFTNDGIRRVLAFQGTTLADYTTTTTSAVTVTGTARNGRVVSGGTLRVANNLTAVTCDYSPSAVTYTTSCNCPISGTWTGTCSDGKSGSLTLNGCGTASFTLGSDTESVVFDRCTSL